MASCDLPSGNYALPEEMENIAYNNESRESHESLGRIEEQQRKAEEVRRKKREEADLKRKKQEIENLAKEEKRKIEEEKRQLEEMRKALMQQQKQLEIEKTKLKREEEKVRRKSRMSDVHVLNTNKRASVLPPPQLSSPKVSALAKNLNPRTPSPSNNRLRGKKESEPSPKIDKPSRSLTPRSSIPSPKTISKHIHNEVSSSMEAREEDPSFQKSEDRESRSQTSEASKRDVSGLPPSYTDLKKPQDDVEDKSLTVTQVKTKRKSREEMRGEMMKANVERRRENTEEMLRRMEAVKEKAGSRREELELGKREKSKKLEESKSADDNN